MHVSGAECVVQISGIKLKLKLQIYLYSTISCKSSSECFTFKNKQKLSRDFLYIYIKPYNTYIDTSTHTNKHVIHLRKGTSEKEGANVHKLGMRKAVLNSTEGGEILKLPHSLSS